MGAHYERCFYSCLDLGQIFGLMREKNLKINQFHAKVFCAQKTFAWKSVISYQLNCYSIRSKNNLKLFRREAAI